MASRQDRLGTSQEFSASSVPPTAPPPTSPAELFQRKLHAIKNALDHLTQSERTWTLAPSQWPWYLLLGARASGKTTLLTRLAQRVSPRLRPVTSDGETTADCDGWIFDTTVVFDTSGQYALAARNSAEHAAWNDLVLALHAARSRQALNGIVLTVAADTVASQPSEALRRDAATLRLRLDEVRREWRANLPVYIVLTRCDLIEGFVDFAARLPEHMCLQPFGWMYATQPPTGNSPKATASATPFEEMSATLLRRLEQLRLVILANETLLDRDIRQRILCFPEEIRALQHPLHVFLDALCSPTAQFFTPFIRGVFLCSAHQHGRPLSLVRRELGFAAPRQPLHEGTEGYFLHDLITAVLPRDRNLRH